MIIIMGVSGTGKTTVGQQLAHALACPFYDADDFHPQSNKDKMAKGKPLDDNDRLPWLNTLNAEISRWSAQGQAILACSALKESYRTLLSKGHSNLTWVVLNGNYEQLAERLNNRRAHFFAPELLQSQLDTLEVPSYGIHISIHHSVRDIVQQILNAF